MHFSSGLTKGVWLPLWEVWLRSFQFSSKPGRYVRNVIIIFITLGLAMLPILHSGNVESLNFHLVFDALKNIHFYKLSI